MSEIPEDISQAAKECYEGLPIVWDGWDEGAVMLCIAQAILAERNRCAKIADDEADRRLNNEGNYPMWRVHDFMVVARSIASAIRG